MSTELPPRLSIVIATYNAARTLEDCLCSAIDQTYPNWELLIVDGGSTDRTVDIIRAHAERIEYWTSEKDSGIYDAWNKALDHARGEYVCFLGADDKLQSPDTISSIFDAIGNNEYELVTGRGRLIDPSGRSYHEFGNPWNYHKVARRITICHPGMLHRRDLFDRFGKYDTSYKIVADYDFLLRLPDNIRTLHIDSVFADIADGGISRQRRWKMLRERFRAQANCPRVGNTRAAFNFVDKLWRIPVAKFLGIPN